MIDFFVVVKKKKQFLKTIYFWMIFLLTNVKGSQMFEKNTLIRNGCGKDQKYVALKDEIEFY